MQSCVAICVDNIHPIEPIIANHEPYLPKGCDIYHLAKENIKSIADYNRLLVSKRLWRNLNNFEAVIIVQWDSFLLRNGIEDFLKFDFCGANIKWLPKMFNGGLSIRSTKAMLNVINTIPYDGDAEDLYFCKALYQLNGTMPTRDEANKFSVETEFHLGSCGGHAISKYLTVSECDSIMNQYK